MAKRTLYGTLRPYLWLWRHQLGYFLRVHSCPGCRVTTYKRQIERAESRLRAGQVAASG